MDKEFVIKGFKELGTGNRDYGRGIVRLHPSVAATIDLSRHGLVRIENLANRKVKYAIFRPHEAADDVVGLEYDDRLMLGIEEKGSKISLSITRAPSLYYMTYFLNHPDMNIRLTFLFAIIFSVFSAFIGFLLGLLA